MYTVELFKRLGIPDIEINSKGDTVPFVDEVLSLGVILDETLTWKKQVNHVSLKANKVLYSLRFIRFCASQLLRPRLVESFVLPHLDYCTVVYADISIELRTQLQRLSNTGIRYTFGARHDERITPYRKELKWLTNDTRRDFFAMLLMYRLVRIKEPPLLLMLFRSYHTDKSNKRTP